MNPPNLPDLETALSMPAVTLANMRLLKSADEGEDGPWSFKGVASDESEDVEGDAILRKALDVSYAQKRGYVNWDHKRDPEFQLGYLTKCEIITDKNIDRYGSLIGRPLSKTASVYVEGELYKYVPKAVEVHNIMKSSPDGAGIGLSLDGAVARDTSSGTPVKAFVRGVAITPMPAHPLTMLRLAKSLQAYQELLKTGRELNPDLPGEIADQVIARLRKADQTTHQPKLSEAQALLWVLRKKPNWTYNVASQFVRWTIARQGKQQGA